MGLPKRKVVFQAPIFRCYVSFNECIWDWTTHIRGDVDHWHNIPVVSRHSHFGGSKSMCKKGMGHIFSVGRFKNLGCHIQMISNNALYWMVLNHWFPLYNTLLLGFLFVCNVGMFCCHLQIDAMQVGMPRFCFLRIPTKSSIYPEYRTGHFDALRPGAERHHKFPVTPGVIEF